VAVIRERHHHLGSRAQQLAVELAHSLGKVEHDLRYIGPALEIAASLELEEVPLGAQYHVMIEAVA
jgi:hypothetical protein